MKAPKGAGLLLLLSVPFALFAAWQVNGVVRTDMIVSDAPPDRGATKEQLATARTKAAAWSAEVRKAAAVAWQYRAPGPDDATADEAVNGVERAAALRSAELNDLDLFLTGVERPSFAGKLKDSYDRWNGEANQTRKDEREVREWLTRSRVITSAADADKVIREADGLIDRYSERSKFADRAKAAVWRVRARLLVAKALATLADAQYRTAVSVKLPLKPGNNEANTAVDTLTGLKKQIDSLNEAVKQATEDKVPLDGALRGEVDAQGAVADQSKASLELLKLFARPDLFTNAAGAAAWLKQVGDQYGNTKDERVKALIREKVQEFCEAFIPAAVRLDDTVLLRGIDGFRAVPREVVKVKYPIGAGQYKRVDLSTDVDGLNEFNVAQRHPGDSTFITYAGSEDFPKDLKPTDLSKAAVVFTGERKKVGVGTTGPKWTAKSVGRLKNTCEAQKELVDKVDQLKAPKIVVPAASKGPEASKPTADVPDDELKIGTRLKSLADGLKTAPALVGDAP